MKTLHLWKNKKPTYPDPHNLNSPIQRMWINCPSTLQPYHKHHGKRGVALYQGDKALFLFCEGDYIGIEVDTLYLSQGWPKRENKIDNED